MDPAPSDNVLKKKKSFRKRFHNKIKKKFSFGASSKKKAANKGQTPAPVQDEPEGWVKVGCH
jgi:hypothetical protein